MAKYVTTVTASAEQKITYKFICTKCGKEAFVHIPVKETETYQTTSLNIEDFKANSQEKVSQKLRNRLDEMKRLPIIKKCEPTGALGKCPHCEELQTWSKIGLIHKPLSIFTSMALWLSLGAVITVFMGIFGQFYDDAYWLVVPPVLLAAVGITLGILSNKKYSQRIDAATKEFEEIPPEKLPEVIIP